MAKLYWRVKRDGKWTWRPADVDSEDDSIVVVLKENVYDDIPLLEDSE